jgi:hypothetical protein
MNAPSAPTRGRNMCRLVARATVIGAVASIAAASVTSAVPSEPDESAECHPYGTGIDDCGFYPDPPDNGGGSSSGSSSSNSSGGCHGSDSYGFDIIKITSTGIDFGDSNWIGLTGEPFGSGSVNWSVPDCDWYTARVVGTLHLNNVSGQFGRMHVSYWWGGDHVATRHSGILHATDNGHEELAVNMSGNVGTNVDEVHVCTEISDDGVNFDLVECKERFL